MTRMKRAYRGLYGNRMIQFGNKISFAENKSRRTWKPNVQVKSVYSETLGRKLRFRMTTYVMRCIRKHGGIDEYLIKTKDSEIKYPRALRLKERIIALRAAEQESASILKTEDGVMTDRLNEGVTQHKGRSVASAIRSTSPVKRHSMGLMEVTIL